MIKRSFLNTINYWRRKNYVMYINIRQLLNSRRFRKSTVCRYTPSYIHPLNELKIEYYDLSFSFLTYCFLYNIIFLILHQTR